MPRCTLKKSPSCFIAWHVVLYQITHTKTREANQNFSRQVFWSRTTPSCPADAQSFYPNYASQLTQSCAGLWLFLCWNSCVRRLVVALCTTPGWMCLHGSSTVWGKEVPSTSASHAKGRNAWGRNRSVCGWRGMLKDTSLSCSLLQNGTLLQSGTTEGTSQSLLLLLAKVHDRSSQSSVWICCSFTLVQGLSSFFFFSL